MHKTFTLFFLLVSATVFGQENFGHISFQLSFPQGEYKETFPKTGWGGRLSVLHKFNNSPFSLGGEVGYLRNGSDRKRFWVPFYGRNNRMVVTASNNMTTIALKGRADLIPEGHNIQLFVEGTAGTNIFYSKVNYDHGDYNDYYYDYYGYYPNNSNSLKSRNQWTFMWGPGMGIEIALDKRNEAALLLKGSWLFGTNTKYLTDPYIDNNADAYFTERESKTDMLIGEIGIRFNID